MSLSIEMLPDGRHLCPKCGGGSDGEHSLSVRRDVAGGVYWRCYRSSCGYWGVPGGARFQLVGVKREPKPFTRPIEPLTESQFAVLWDRFALDGSTVEGYDVYADRFVLGVYGPVGYNRRGVVAYSFNQSPKSIVYNEKPDEPFIHYAGDTNAGGAGGLVLVEDWFSAEKVATTREAIGVCLNGTFLEQGMISELVEVAGDRPTWVALDRDAYTKTLLYLSRYREQFPGGLFAWSLRKDLKYETTERIREALVNGKVDFTSDDEQPRHL